MKMKKKCYFCGRTFDFRKEGSMIITVKKSYYSCDKCQDVRRKAIEDFLLRKVCWN